MNRYIVTGGAGFIGSAVIRHLITCTDAEVVTLDKLTYAGNLQSLGDALTHHRHFFEKVDLSDREAVAKVFEKYQPTAVLHLAAESHVDRSIDDPSTFIKTNLAVVEKICGLLDELAPSASGHSYCEQMRFVPDRPGHDYRYAIDSTRTQKELGWRPSLSFDDGLRATVNWYLDNLEWCARVQDGAYEGERLGVTARK